MFFHKSKPIAAGFACAAAVMIIGLAANPVQADRRNAYQQDSYYGERSNCNHRQIGIIQKMRDGVNYFYGGSDVASPRISYIYLRNENIGQPYFSPPYRTSYQVMQQISVGP